MNIKLRTVETHAQGPAEIGCMLAGPAPQAHRAALPPAPEFPDALLEHQAAHDGEERHVGDDDDEVELACPSCRREEPYAQRRSHESSRHQYGAELVIEGIAAQRPEHARRGGGDDLRGLSRHRDGRGNSEEDQERRHQKAAADAEEP
jgi:hypothetical protein